MTEKTAIEFLFFSYFGEDIVSIKADENKLINTAIHRAYRDAASHVLQFDFEAEINKDEKEKIVNAYQAVASTKIYEYLISISEKKGILSENWVEELAKTLIRLYEMSQKALEDEMDDDINENVGLNGLETYEKKNVKFTFGIAQKWINMTIKNLYVMKAILKIYSDEENIYLSNICETFNVGVIDIPVDDYIIKASCNELLLEVPSENKTKEYKDNRCVYSKKLAWSNWKIASDADQPEKSYYGAYQHRLKECLANDETFKDLGDVLDRENRLWINTALGKYNAKRKMK